MAFWQAGRTGALLICISGGIYAGTHTLDTTSYNFQLNNGGGGASAVLDGSTNIEIFCNDFANSISVPHTNYSANLTSITSGSDLSKTRFGGNTSWTTITINDDGTDAGSNDAADSAIINGSTALGRYQMAAFLVSQYNRPAGNTLSNNGIQRAIWWLLDPVGSATPPSLTNNSFDSLESAAEWYQTTGGNTGSAARNTFLAGYKIVSDSTMYSCGAGKALCGGFQEQIDPVAAVPEPRQFAFMLGGLLFLCSVKLRKHFGVSRSKA
jgi:hypothetical protein